MMMNHMNTIAYDMDQAQERTEMMAAYGVGVKNLMIRVEAMELVNEEAANEN